MCQRVENRISLICGFALALTGRMIAALRLLADKIEAWTDDRRPERREKDERLVGALT
ncbi:MAG: hypothetical protein V1790_04470 [Planctomycetota bacterium]